jgi:hypothetical protein
VRRLLAEGSQESLPVDVAGLASLLGIKRRLSDAPFAGRIYVEPSGQLVMDLRARDSDKRRRFSCAHEIIHTLFPGFQRESRYRVDIQTSGHHRERSEEEYLCDLGASELLMPEDLLDPSRHALELGLEGIENLAADADVSLEAAGNRLVGLSERRILFLVLEVGHKPAETRALARGEQVEQRLRVRYATAAPGLNVFIPRHKSADPEGPFAQALATWSRVQGIGAVPGDSIRAYEIQAKSYPYQVDGVTVDRVLALAEPMARSSSSPRY